METASDGMDRTSMLRAAVAKVPSEDLRAALGEAADPARGVKAAGNALHALRRHRDPAAVVDRPQYRAAVPYLAATIAEKCLARTVELLGDDSEDPTREQLDAALDEVCGSFPVTTVAVMLASVAHDDLPSSDLCFDLLVTEPRFGLTGPADPPPPSPPAGPRPRPSSGATAEQRAARRERKGQAAAVRRRQAEVARRADEQLRRARKDVRWRDRRDRPS